MGLRINTNTASITAMRHLAQADRVQQRSLERLSTGLRINRAADDPSGLVISEQLRAQISGLNQALQNSENASNMIGTAEAALNEVSRLLITIRESATFALNSGGSSTEQITAEQESVNNAILAIDRIGSSTRFASRNLLDGSSSFRVTNQSGEIRTLDLRAVNIDGFASKVFTITPTVIAARASSDLGLAAALSGGTGGNITLQIAGDRGTATVTFASSTLSADVYRAINDIATTTGVFASAGDNRLYTINYGTDAFITVQQVGGSGTYAGTSVTSPSRGTDFAGTIDGNVAYGKGEYLTINTPAIDAVVHMNASTSVAASNYTFTLQKSGLKFQLNETESPADSLNIGLRSINSGTLGTSKQTVTITNGGVTQVVTLGGFLNELKSGGGFDLVTDPGQAVAVVDDVIDKVNKMRAYLGAVQSNVIDSNTTAVSVSLENLRGSESTIRDLDFAAETSEFTRTQILFQASTAVLASANLIPQTVLTLLR